jgi:hypothetical protein
VIIAVWAVLVTLLELLGIFSKAFLALFAGKCLAIMLGRSSLGREKVTGYHVGLLQQLVIGLLVMTLGTVEPFSACGESACVGASSWGRMHTTR